MLPNQSYLKQDRLKRILTAHKFNEYLRKALEARFGRKKQ